MKQIKLFGLLCFMILTAIFSSCSENGKLNGLMENIPEETDLVLVGNVKTIIESAGGTIEDSKIKLPSYIASILSEKETDDLDDANIFFKKAGIDTEACALMLDYKQNRPVVIFSLNDKKKFVDAIESEKFKEKSSEEDVTIYSKKVYEGHDSYYDDYGYIAINGSYAYWIDRVWVGSDFKPISYLQEIIENAKESNFADTPYADYITNGNVGGLSIAFPKELTNRMKDSGLPAELASVYDGVVCMRGELTDNKCTVSMKIFDADGKEMSADKYSKLFDTSATINEKALDLLGKDEFMIYALSIKNFNWDNYADIVAQTAGMSRSAKAEFNAMLSYFEKIDGTVAWGFGLNGGLESVRNMYNDKDPLNQFSTTIVVETKEGKAKQLIEDMKGFLEKTRMPFNETKTGLSVDLGQARLSGSLYVENIDNFIVLANHPIKKTNDNALVKQNKFSDYLLAFCFGLNKDNALMRDLNIKNDVKLGMYCKPKSMEASMILEIDGDDDGGVIAKAAKMIIKIAEQSDKIKQNPAEIEVTEDISEAVVDSVAVEGYID